MKNPNAHGGNLPAWTGEPYQAGMPMDQSTCLGHDFWA